MPVSSQGAVDLGVDLETWLIRYDKAGTCTSPKTAQALLKRLERDADRPVILFSHGWNNDFDAATTLYAAFLRQLAIHLDAYPLAAQPIFVGVIWPSIALSFNAGLRIAGEPSLPAQEIEQDHVSFLAAALSDPQRQRFYTLMEADRIADVEARELAELLSESLARSEPPADDDGTEDRGAPASADLYAALRTMASSVAPVADDPDVLPPGGVLGARTMSHLDTAGLIGYLDPRWALRVASVYQMKDRAAIVGSRGVSTFLSGLLQRERTIHLVGHSYGCKVVLSALAHEPGRLAVESILLLQPAVSHLAFAANVAGTGRPGGYRKTLEQSRQPPVMTYSAADWPLHKLFHLALQRRADLGELRIGGFNAAQPGLAGTSAGEPPNPYAALGGYGPRGAGETLAGPLPAPGTLDALAGTHKLLAFDGSGGHIKGHGDVHTPLTAWLLYLQLRRGVNQCPPG
jgi:hypothetical protein